MGNTYKFVSENKYGGGKIRREIVETIPMVHMVINMLKPKVGSSTYGLMMRLS